MVAIIVTASGATFTLAYASTGIFLVLGNPLAIASLFVAFFYYIAH
jgi:hypothetical protein